MKKLFLALSLVSLLAGCASHNNDTGDQYNNNATHGTGTDTGTNNNQGQNTMSH